MLLDFLTLHPDAFGLDISDLSFKVAKLKKTAKGLKLSSFGEFDIPAGYIVQGEIKKEKELVSLIHSSLKNVHGEKLKTRNAVISLPEEKAFLQVIQLPRLEQEALSQAALFESENYIPYPLETVYVDSQVVAPMKNHLDHTDVLLASLPRDTVDSYVSLFKASGINTLAFDIESLAQARALISKEISQVPFLIMDMGGAETNFIVFAGTSVRFTASSPVSSHNLTENVAKALGCDIQKAEELKLLHGVADAQDPQGAKVRDALVPVLQGFAAEMKKYIEYYSSHASHQHTPSDEKDIKKVILCGGGANLKGLEGFLSQALRIQVVLGNPWVNIMKFPLKVLPPISLEESLKYSTVLGLALRGAQV